MSETDDLVTKEQSIKLHRLGFDWVVRYYYRLEYAKPFYQSENQNYNISDMRFSAPTVSMAIRWLDTKGVYVDSSLNCDFMWYFDIYDRLTPHKSLNPNNTDEYKSRLEAESSGLSDGLDYYEKHRK